MMRLLFLIILFLIALLAGCDAVTPATATPVRAEPEKIMNEDQAVIATVRYFTHKGHRYIRFRYQNHSADSGTVHDPDCPCFEQR